jgi:hypothetical protein
MVADPFWKRELKRTVGSSPITPTISHKRGTMKVTRKSIMLVVEAVLESGFKKATKILDAKTKVTFTAKKNSKGNYMLTIGSPNYAERAYINQRKKAGLTFNNVILYEG